MRIAPRVLALASLLALYVPGSVEAEWHFTPFFGYTFKGSTNLVDFENATDDTHWNLGGAVTLLGDGPFGVEGYFVWTPSFFQEDPADIVGPRITSSRTYTVMGNVVLATPRNWNRYGLRPYFSGGLGVIHADTNDPVLPLNIDVLGMNLGGGATGLITERVGVRFDFRYFRNLRGVNEEDLDFPITTDGEAVRFRHLTIGVGVVIKY